MNTLLAGSAIIALTAGAASGATVRPTIEVHDAAAVALSSKASATLLYNQNSDGTDGSVSSQNFTSCELTSGCYTAAADDFVVASPATMTGVDVTGLFYNGSGPANGANAYLYTGGKAPNGSPIASGTSAGFGPNFFVPLKHKLKAGKHYWISVVVNCSFISGCGQWGWEERLPHNNKLAVWEYPQGGGNCKTWKPIGDCTGYPTSAFPTPDLMFDIRGK